jgi:tRNA threonylcarbamoyladenosine biosynthesis protein TsaB
MLVLSLDTTTRAGSAALAHDGRVLREEASDPALPPASRLPGDLKALLEREGVELARIDVFAVATGPGSFTGMRVGIATMQGLALAMGKPLIGVSGFDALALAAGSAGTSRGEAANAPPPGRVATWVDAWRGEVYAALYEDGREAAPPVVAPPDRLLPALQGHPTLFVGDGAATFEDLIVAALGDRARMARPLAPLLAGAVARLAADAARAGHRPPPHAVRPLYVRRSDAELAQAPPRTPPTP